MLYDVVLHPGAEKELRRIVPADRRRLSNALRGLTSQPRPVGAKLLRGQDRMWRIRVGDYRIVYRIDDVEKTVAIERIGHRREVYR